MGQIANAILIIGASFFAISLLLNVGNFIKYLQSIRGSAKFLGLVWFIWLIGLGLWFGRDEPRVALGIMDRSALLQVMSVVIGGIAFIVLSINNAWVKNLRGPLLFLILYGIYGVLTSPVSPAVYLSVFKAISIVILALLGVVAVNILRKQNHSEFLVEISCFYFSILLLLSALGGVLVPHITRKPNPGLFGFLLEGFPHLNSNSLSYIAAIVAITALCQYGSNNYKFSSKTYVISKIILAMSVLLLAQGRTAIIGLLLSFVMLSVYMPKLRYLLFMIFFAILLGYANYAITGNLGDGFGTVEAYLRRGATEKSLASMSGRTDAWSIGWESFLKAPGIGHGFYSSNFIGIAAHNSYINVLIDCGMIGFSIWFAMLASTLNRCLFVINRWSKNEDFDRYTFNLQIGSILIIQFLRTITGSDITVNSYSLILFTSIIVYVYSVDTMKCATEKTDLVQYPTN
ncbi:hypothetical protein OR1_03019 [Geobacter sp. OR-1]|uniref:O-antigen ligase family protein n=1 Tax=Geobacter sp. OR-1 TaxID=1266765 RepID=UPI0005444422|nr:O-antigen ligase family protein [Geobacter sp. OR-1]GAM10726.1 hypothetical protein OR1_03019 [Geobacter sp. OR-1]